MASMWLYLIIYFVGLVLGVGANVLLDVQLRRPALSKQIVLAAFGVVLAVIIFQWSTSPEQWIVLGLWGVTGALCGLGEILVCEGEYEDALFVFQAALRLNPHLEAARAAIEQILHGDAHDVA